MDKVDPTIREWLYAREMMRRLGYQEDDLFFVVNPHGIAAEDGQVVDFGKPTIYLVLRTQGKEFRWLIGPIDVPLKDIEAEYNKARDIWNAGPPEEDPGFRKSMAFKQSTALVRKLYDMGFRFSDEIRN